MNSNCIELSTWLKDEALSQLPDPVSEKKNDEMT